MGLDQDDFWSKVSKGDGCWPWLFTKNNYGYGVVAYDGKYQASAHRVAYELIKGPIPDGLQIDHLCRNPACVNPAHLEAVTQRENILRGESMGAVNARKTHCSRGHEYTEENRLKSMRPHWRRCKTCNAIGVKRRAERNKLND